MHALLKNTDQWYLNTNRLVVSFSVCLKNQVFYQRKIIDSFSIVQF